MKSRPVLGKIAVALLCAVAGLMLCSIVRAQPEERPAFQVSLDPGHPWRSPFGLDRVGRPVVVSVLAQARPARTTFTLTALLKGKEAAKYPVQFPESPPYSARVTLDREADLLVLRGGLEPDETGRELARQAITVPDFEADAKAQPDALINPVDLGTILVPSGWLLLRSNQRATLEMAAISRIHEHPRAQGSASYASMPGSVVSAAFPLRAGAREKLVLNLPAPARDRDRDVLSVTLDDGDGRQLWKKDIPVMLARELPRHVAFGATYEKLRFDAPISVRDRATGKYSDLAYDKGWNSELRDVVVWLPNGARFVFWRGSSYIPFWAGRQNTGACYEWAEIISQPKGAVDCVEPLMDKELRYGKVEIIQSTSALVHVRWTYQSTDLEYKVWGDQAVEDYYFYPDGFGTRVLTLKSDPKNLYELSEFIILTPAGAYPFDVLPENAVDALFLDGRKHEFRLPNPTAPDPVVHEADKKAVPAIYRLRMARNEELSAVYFNPGETRLPPVVFGPFFDAGQMVTPCYWGSHWPLARGNSTGSKIDDRIAFTPCHNSVMSWAGTRPEAIQSATIDTIDAVGASRRMIVRRWAWLIGASAAGDAELRDRARSFATPPDLELTGARPDFAGYAIERRAARLEATAREFRIEIKPKHPCVNPVFEFPRAPRGVIQMKLAGEALAPRQYAWDGRTLWLDRTIASPTMLEIRFGAPVRVQPIKGTEDPS